jgi:hypothetical protein
MLKRWLSIFAVTLAAVVMVAVHSVPHHHHGEMICFVSACCDGDHDDACTGEHSHHHDSHLPGHHDTCIVEDGYLFSFEYNESKCKAAPGLQDQHKSHTPFLFVAFHAAACPHNEAICTDRHTRYGARDACFYQSADASRENGLRAPPCPAV